MTMGHSTDGPILTEILRTRSFPYLGVIGSAAKAARLKKDLREAGLPPRLDPVPPPMFTPFRLRGLTTSTTFEVAAKPDTADRYRGTIRSITLVGGTKAISAGVESQIRSQSGLSPR